MKKLAIFLYYVIFLGSLQAQSVFSFEQIGLKSDSLPKQLVEYFDPGERGTDLQWDFSRQLRSSVIQPVVYHSDSLGRISAIGKGLLCRYRLKTDTLFLIESNYIRMVQKVIKDFQEVLIRILHIFCQTLIFL